MSRTLMVFGLLSVTALASCKSSTHTEKHHDEGEHGEHQAAALPGESSDSPVILLEGLRGIRWLAAPQPRAEGAWFPGEAIGDESAQSVLSSPVGGRVV